MQGTEQSLLITLNVKIKLLIQETINDSVAKSKYYHLMIMSKYYNQALQIFYKNFSNFIPLIIQFFLKKLFKFQVVLPLYLQAADAIFERNDQIVTLIIRKLLTLLIQQSSK